jgi:hypothetical protein
MKKITFDFTPYVLGSCHVEVTRYNENDELISYSKFTSHKIDGRLKFENFDVGGHNLSEAEKSYIETILLNN